MKKLINGHPFDVIIKRVFFGIIVLMHVLRGTTCLFKSTIRRKTIVLFFPEGIMNINRLHGELHENFIGNK